MARTYLSLAVLLVIGTSSVFASSCKVTSQTYSAQDGTVLTHIAHIISFTAECPANVQPLYANLNPSGLTLAVVRGEGEQTYQVSWTNELAKASSGSYNVEIFDEEGYQQFKKSQRSGSSDASSALAVLAISHSSPYKGPLFAPELVVLVSGLFLTYLAIANRCKIVSKKI